MLEGEPRHIIGFGGEGGIGCGGADHGKLEALSFQDEVRLGDGKPATLFIPNVGSQEGKGGRRGKLTQSVKPPVEFVVAQRHGVELQGVHDLDDRLAAKDVGNRGPLKHIPGRQQEDAVRIFRSLFGDQPGQTASASDGHGVADGFVRIGQKMPMEVIDVEQGELYRRQSSNVQGNNHQQQQEKNNR